MSSPSLSSSSLSGPSSSSSTEPQCPRPNVSEQLAKLLEGEKADTRAWFRTEYPLYYSAELDQMVDPMVESLFRRLADKLSANTERNLSTETSTADDGASGDRAPVAEEVIKTESFSQSEYPQHSSLLSIPTSSSSSYVNSVSTLHSEGDALQYDPKENENAVELSGTPEIQRKQQQVPIDADDGVDLVENGSKMYGIGLEVDTPPSNRIQTNKPEIESRPDLPVLSSPQPTTFSSKPANRPKSVRPTLKDEANRNPAYQLMVEKKQTYDCTIEALLAVPVQRKCAIKSLEERTLGNKQFGDDEMYLAADNYTRALLYAPNVTEAHPEKRGPRNGVPRELSLAYGNRSAVFHKLGWYDECRIDIDHALATGYPPEKEVKLLLRKAECLIALSRFTEANTVLKRRLSSSTLDQMEDERLNRIRQHLLDIEAQGSRDDAAASKWTSQEPVHQQLVDYLCRSGRYQVASVELKSLSSLVEPRSTPTKGRHLVAKQDIQPGDILMVEAPFVCVLNQASEKLFCHHCARRLRSVEKQIGGKVLGARINGAHIPCTHCTHVLYCSPLCRTTSWQQYHRYECAILPALYMTGDICLNGRLALRMLFTTGLDAIQQVSSSTDAKEETNLSEPTDVTGHYEHVYRLVTQQDVIPVAEFKQHIENASFLVRLAIKGGFVRTTAEQKAACSILLRHVQQGKANAHVVDFYDEVARTMTRIGLALYPFNAGQVNHSCDPNSWFGYLGGAILIQRASKRIAAGEEVTTSYGFTFEETALKQRRAAIYREFGFMCTCPRCVLETRDGLTSGLYFPIGCGQCEAPLVRANVTTSTLSCSRGCSTTTSNMSRSDVEKLYAQIETQLTTLNSLVKSLETEPNNGELLRSCEKTLSELSAIPGLKKFHKFTQLYGRLGKLLAQSNPEKARKYFWQHCELNELYGGVHDRLCRLYLELFYMYDELEVLVDEVNQMLKPIAQHTLDLIDLLSLEDTTSEEYSQKKCFSLVESPYSEDKQNCIQILNALK